MKQPWIEKAYARQYVDLERAKPTLFYATRKLGRTLRRVVNEVIVASRLPIKPF